MSARLIVQEQSGRITVSLQPGGQPVATPAGEPFEFENPLTTEQREDLRWYLEDYLQAPFAVYEERGEQIQSQLVSWGEALFAALFGPGRQARDAYLQARGSSATELVVSSNNAGFLALPWELLKDPEQAEPLALSLTTFDRIFGTAASAVENAASGDVLRVLMVIARPQGVHDIGYQMVARRLLERLDAVRGRVELDVLRPPTLEALRTRQQEAETDRRPYQIVHFDGHGTFGSAAAVSGTHQYDVGAPQGYLVFEQDSGGEHLVEAGQFALTVNRYKLPLVVLNACRAGMLGEAAVEAAVATRLLEGGAASVVGMGYSVYAVAAAEFMTAFYEALFAGESVSAAVIAGRRRLYNHKGRPSPKGPLPLDDWMVPVHYLRQTVNFPALKQARPTSKPSLDQILGQLGQQPATVAGVPVEGSLEAVGRFVGRDAEFYELELALRLQRVVVVYGPGGMGKTELAKGFARWWRDSGGIDRPDLVLFHSFEPGVASFGLDGVVTAIGLKLFGPEFIGKTSGVEQRRSVVLEALRQYRMALVWDNFESVYTMPDPNSATPVLDEKQRKEIAGFLVEMARHGQSGVIITSRTPETWLGNIRRIELGGLRPAGAAEFADDVLAPYPCARARREERAYADLLNWFGGHPLSMRLRRPAQF
jgi:CHAT domain